MTRQLNHSYEVEVLQEHESIQSFDYSDGDEVEIRLLSALKACKDLGATSAELSRHVTDWPSKYHLSPSRHNLLRSIDWDEGTQILELGCGCGAMTRYLGESGADVIAVEGSMRRKEIAAQRCRDLPNVRVICNNLMDFTTSQRFDIVTLIGVLEYAPRYIVAKDPISVCLKKAASFLKPDGVLVLAIENQLGLKYFNGCDEDHLGWPYYGLHGLYCKDEPTTLGRAVLESKLTDAGLPKHRIFFPFPDYKLPQVILSESALTTQGFDAAALLAGITSGNVAGEFHPNFHENLAWRAVVENGLLSHLTNSFLIVAASTDEALRKLETDWIACTYTTSRTPSYATETRFTQAGNKILVKKQRLYPEIPLPNVTLPTGGLKHLSDTVSDYIVGTPYLLDLQRRLGRNEGIDGVIEWAAPWLELLLAHSSVSESGLVLPGEWIDAIPQNFILDEDGRLRRIDNEWRIDGTVPLETITLRGLLISLGMSPTSIALQGVKIRDLLKEISASKGVSITDAAFDSFLNSDSKFISAVENRNQDEARQRLGLALDYHVTCQVTPEPAIDYYNRVVKELREEILRVKSTVSWRLTKPLRGVWNFFLLSAVRYLPRKRL